MNEQAFYRVSIKGTIIDEQGHVLLAREGDRWELLGGGLDHGEDPKAALAREIYEETGMKVTSISERPLYFLTSPSLSGDFYVANVIYEMQVENLDFTLSAECEELRFFSPADMKTVKLFPNVKKLQELLSAAS